MSEKRVYYRLHSTTMESCNLMRPKPRVDPAIQASNVNTREAFQQLLATVRKSQAETTPEWECRGCSNIKPGVGSIDVHLQQSSISDGPLNSVSASVGLACRSFLEQLGEDVIERDLYLGKVFNDKGRLLEDWCTFHARRHVIVRGYVERAEPDYPENRPAYRICHRCGRVLYGALLNKYHYLYPAPSTDAEVFECRTTLIVPDYLFAKLDIPHKAKIAVDRLEVLDEPLDGLGVLEPWEPDRSKWGERHRTMRGCTRLTDEVRRKGTEDVEARDNGYYRRIVWHFFPDAETGRIEIARDLRQVMEDADIECVLHE